jgi:hypothetical protein
MLSDILADDAKFNWLDCIPANEDLETSYSSASTGPAPYFRKITHSGAVIRARCIAKDRYVVAIGTHTTDPGAMETREGVPERPAAGVRERLGVQSSLSQSNQCPPDPALVELRNASVRVREGSLNLHQAKLQCVILGPLETKTGNNPVELCAYDINVRLHLVDPVLSGTGHAG